MNDVELENLVAKLKKRKARATKEMIAKVSQELGGVQFPEEYERFLLLSNGACGFLASGGRYLHIYPIEDLPKLNKGYLFTEVCPHLVLFGSDGGGNGFSFDTRGEPMPVAESDFVVLEEPRIVASSFADFLLRLAAGDRLPW